MTTPKSNPATPHKIEFIASRRDPIPEKRARREELGGSVDIDNRGGSLYVQEDQCRINHKYLPQAELQRLENEDNGLGAYTNTEVYIMSCGFNDYHDWEDYDWDEPVILHDPILVQYGDDPDEFYMDDGASCSFPKGGAGASIIAEESTAETTEPTAEQQAFLDANAEPQGELTTAFSAAADPEQSPLPNPALVAANSPVYQAPALQA